VKSWLLLLLLATPVFAQAQAQQDRMAPSCGLSNAKFTVKTTNAPAPVTPADAGKALLYLIQDDTNFESRPRPSVRFGMDGQWVGATKSNSWFVIPVDPGEHHLCANWQRRVVLLTSDQQLVAAAHFAAKPGASYFFRMRDTWSRDAGLSIDFTPLDGDEGQLLMRKFSFNSSQPKK
jgi:hypothetical protein